MREILKILSEDLSLKKAMRIRELKKDMESRWLRKTFLPIMCVMATLAVMMFAMIVLMTYFGNGDATMEDLPDVGISLVFLVIGTGIGMLIAKGDDTTMINEIINPVIDRTLEKACENETEH